MLIFGQNGLECGRINKNPIGRLVQAYTSDKVFNWKPGDSLLFSKRLM